MSDTIPDSSADQDQAEPGLTDRFVENISRVSAGEWAAFGAAEAAALFAIYRFMGPGRGSSDPRDRMAHQLVLQGHASMDEILHASFGEWPPKGLDIAFENNQRVSLLSFKDYFGGEVPKEYRNAAGLASLHGERKIGLYDPHMRGRANVNITLGHEAVHILQGDHYWRARDVFGSGGAQNIWGSQRGASADLIMQNAVDGNIREKGFLTRVFKETQHGGVVASEYFRKGIEIQSRIHEMMMAGYPHWERLPLNQEELWVSMINAGVKPPQEILQKLEQSPTIEETRKLFGQKRIYTSVSSDFNAMQRTLTDVGQEKFWQDAMPRMYADLIEMYGDGPGRERFGYGTNVRREMRLDFERNNTLEGRARMVADKPWHEVQDRNGAGARYAYVDDMNTQQRDDLRRALREFGIEFETKETAMRGGAYVIAVKGDYVQVVDALRVGILPSDPRFPVVAGPMARQGEKITSAAWEDVRDRNGNIVKYADLSRMDSDQRLSLESSLRAQGIEFEIKRSSLRGGIDVIAVSGEAVGKVNGIINAANLRAPAVDGARSPPVIEGARTPAMDIPRSGGVLSAAAPGLGVGMGALNLAQSLQSGDTGGAAISGADVAVGLLDTRLAMAQAAGRTVSSTLMSTVSRANIALVAADMGWQVYKEDGNFINADGSVGHKGERLAAAGVTTGVAIGTGAALSSGFAAAAGGAAVTGAAAVAAPVVVTAAAVAVTATATNMAIENRRQYQQIDRDREENFRAGRREIPQGAAPTTPTIGNYRMLPGALVGVSMHMRNEQLSKPMERFDNGRFKAIGQIDLSDPRNMREFERALDIEQRRQQAILEANDSILPRWMRSGDSVLKYNMAQNELKIIESARQELAMFKQDLERQGSQRAATQPARQQERRQESVDNNQNRDVVRDGSVRPPAHRPTSSFQVAASGAVQAQQAPAPVQQQVTTPQTRNPNTYGMG